MILSGKKLFMYRLNKIKNAVLMFSIGFATALFMMCTFFAFC